MVKYKKQSKNNKKIEGGYVKPQCTKYQKDILLYGDKKVNDILLDQECMQSCDGRAVLNSNADYLQSFLCENSVNYPSYTIQGKDYDGEDRNYGYLTKKLWIDAYRNRCKSQLQNVVSREKCQNISCKKGDKVRVFIGKDIRTGKISSINSDGNINVFFNGDQESGPFTKDQVEFEEIDVDHIPTNSCNPEDNDNTTCIGEDCSTAKEDAVKDATNETNALENSKGGLVGGDQG